MESERMVQEIETKAKETATARGTDIVITAMQRSLPSLMNQHTTSTVTLPSEEIKANRIDLE